MSAGNVKLLFFFGWSCIFSLRQLWLTNIFKVICRNFPKVGRSTAVAAIFPFSKHVRLNYIARSISRPIYIRVFIIQE